MMESTNASPQSLSEHGAFLASVTAAKQFLFLRNLEKNKWRWMETSLMENTNAEAAVPFGTWRFGIMAAAVPQGCGSVISTRV